MPMAVNASALRRLLSARLLRVTAAAVAARVGARISISVSRVRMMRTMAPPSAVKPING